MLTPPLLKVTKLAKSYSVGGRRLQAFQDINLEVARGECVALVGESGCGKSSIAMTIMKLIDADEGKVAFLGHDLSSLSSKQLKQIRQEYGIVFQNPYSTLNPRLSVFKLLEEPLITHTKLNKLERIERVGEMLETVGLASSMIKRMPHELSGGQRQRLV
ncbi:oligopeptide transport ATP-binding protein oppF [Vibrio ishigakensis]|uniref:Oligopeptide transport ATP-binding protein oppF n=1 Tax=Vibrio ishigakensis TaxID=1481914 RepID=A0A0B8Q9H2_9VIBR|nr:oligopeptide transport ATP-binding protein oppF [Vibrio ishigakensis]